MNILLSTDTFRSATQTYGAATVKERYSRLLSELGPLAARQHPLGGTHMNLLLVPQNFRTATGKERHSRLLREPNHLTTANTHSEATI